MGKKEPSVHILDTPYTEHFKSYLDKSEDRFIKDFPVLYILYKRFRKEAYIGETTSVYKRTRQHLNNKREKDLFKRFKTMTILGHEKFNKSATVNLETDLINYFLGDGYSLKNTKQTRMTITSDYYHKHYYETEVLSEIVRSLNKRQILEKNEDAIKNSDVYKISPFKSLSDAQLELKDKVISFVEDHLKNPANEKEHALFIVLGEAGVGKSVVLSSLYVDIQNRAKSETSSDVLNETNNYLLVNHKEMLKTYKNLARQLPNLQQKFIKKPTEYINSMEKGKIKEADVTFIDEAHLLLTKSDAYNGFRHDNQLEEIIKHSKVTVMFFDQHQYLKLKSYWDSKDIDRLLKKHPNHDVFHLTDQFRMKANSQVVDWINDFIENKKIDSLPQKDDKFDFRIFSLAKQMYEIIKDKNKENKLSRMVSTFDYDFSPTKAGTKDENGNEIVYSVKTEDLELPWNTTNDKIAWAERSETINEAGSIYSVQGADLDYVGVILGSALSFDEKKDQVVVRIEKYKDKDAFRSRNDIQNLDKAKEQIVLNSVNVLMKRGIKGLYIYAEDDKLREKLINLE
ncbi:DUF2075 domain-containing protein [Pediococcus claussenii]|uniref:GIY-YIG catalytic domain protein n=1 Tax=Pediococcus claussenii (strain ATCC BAA-344 / DSM 14800 / JCM 18046 / KCTC 3811 / LMG 21948 / P06) TaxID=701521 RepID=G8PB14_PEDCP|nr:DUF2075 domain-containing protein [Pediococcus claussenii]AEV95882.1 GIY-YIG catalytic domain protein [Pediococcus claussenii ATCC BAA-344]ANZ69377.1 hypothetical protein AYR57_03230 [Pediococcus claussenii]ANZ71197.1 hypothetical protein AYR58_03245 [Pediococcus claussenii]KRN20489.1 hypothetical protein IV79_GL000544 [Pediococcus claussenii]